MTRSPRSVVAVMAVAVLPILAACSGGDADDVTDAAGDDATVATTSGGTSGAAVSPGDDATAVTAPSGSASGSVASGVTLPAPDVVPETGVPGLDSDDDFCAAWSRFGGTWQVLLVGSTFLGDPDTIARWEVSASQMLIDAWSVLDAELPAELESERDAALDGYFGVLERRALDARDALGDAGASADDVARLTDAWLAALATRDPVSPDVALVVPVDLADLVDTAASEFRTQRTEFHLDPSLVVTVETPLTDAYLEDQCPDQGTLAGGEVTGSRSPTTADP